MESRRRNDRPELEKALGLAKLTGATLVIAKLDRLSHNAAFLLTLRDSGVRFVACDMPEANDLTVGIMALVAQQEREAISRRTKEALAAAKARGVKLGNPNGAAALRRAGEDGAALRETVSRNADDFAPGSGTGDRGAQGGGRDVAPGNCRGPERQGDDDQAWRALARVECAESDGASGQVFRQSTCYLQSGCSFMMLWDEEALDHLRRRSDAFKYR